MAVPILDDEFMQYWSRLSVVQKESLLGVAKNYVQSGEPVESVGDRRKKMILEDRQNYLQGIEASYSWERVKQMAANNEKRNALLDRSQTAGHSGDY